MKDTRTHCHYTIEIPYSTVSGSMWGEYRGEHIGYDWWNHSPMLFNSEEDAIKTISESDDYKNCSWRIVKTTITSAVTRECKNS